VRITHPLERIREPKILKIHEINLVNRVNMTYSLKTYKERNLNGDNLYREMFRK